MVAGSVTSAAVAGAVAWDVVVGDRFIAAIAAPASDGSMTALAEAASDPRVSLESVISVMPSGARDGSDSFAVVYWPVEDPSLVTAVVRGHAVVDLTSPGGTRRFDSREIQPWHLAEFESVIAVRLTTADAPLDRLGEAPDALRHPRASLRASTVEWASAPTRSREKDPVPDADTVLVSRRRSNPGHGADGDGRPSQPVEHAAADTVLTPRRPSSTAATGRAPATAAEDPPKPELKPKPEPGSEPEPEPQTDSASASAPGMRAPGAGRDETPWFRVGVAPPRRVSGPVLIGRRPLGPRVPGLAGAAPELLAVPSPGQVVSATHLELRLEGTRLVATDLRSTNGTVVRGAGGARRLRAGESIVVVPGTSLDLGDDTIIEIVSAPAAPPE
jgi:hypothetical protein